MYGHVEPVIGIQSSHPLNDTTVYDDDVVVHLTDGGTNTVHRKMTTLPCKWAGVGEPAECGLFYTYGMGPYSFGYAVKGFKDGRDDALPASLHVDPWKSEPDTRSGEKPTPLKGTLTITGTQAGQEYDIYRWDNSKDAFTYHPDFKHSTFKATESEHVFEDPKTFLSSSATYYSCVPASA